MPQGFHITPWGSGDKMYIRSTSTFISFTLRHGDKSPLNFVKSSSWKEIIAKPILELRTRGATSGTKEDWVRSPEPRRGGSRGVKRDESKQKTTSVSKRCCSRDIVIVTGKAMFRR